MVNLTHGSTFFTKLQYLQDGHGEIDPRFMLCTKLQYLQGEHSEFEP